MHVRAKESSDRVSHKREFLECARVSFLSSITGFCSLFPGANAHDKTPPCFLSSLLSPRTAAPRPTAGIHRRRLSPKTAFLGTENVSTAERKMEISFSPLGPFARATYSMCVCVCVCGATGVMLMLPMGEKRKRRGEGWRKGRHVCLRQR
jgi:hypothetical protein